METNKFRKFLVISVMTLLVGTFFIPLISGESSISSEHVKINVTQFGDNIEIIFCGTDNNGLIELEKLLDILYNKGIKKLMVEGGGTVIWNFLESGFVDDFYVYVGPIIIGGEDTPTISGRKGINDDKINLKLIETKVIGPGILLHYRLIK